MSTRKIDSKTNIHILNFTIMITVNTDKETFISGSYNGKNFRIPFTAETFTVLKDLELRANDTNDFKEYMEIIEKFSESIKYDYKSDVANVVDNIVYVLATDSYHISVDGQVLKSVKIPDVIMDLILDNVERDIESTPIIKACMRFLLNPKPTQERFNMFANYITQTFTDSAEVERLMEEEGLDIKVAEEMATYSDLQITTEGYLRTSKVVDEITEKWSIKHSEDGKPILDEFDNPIKEKVPRYATAYEINEETGEVTKVTEYPEYLEDRRFEPAIYTHGDNFFSGGVLGYKYEIGKLADLPSWNFVDMNDGNKHQKGLHTGGLSYIKGYYREGRNEILDVFVCPSQIAKFTDEGLGEMTCKGFYIYGASRMKGNLRSIYHTSSYTTLLKGELEEQLVEIAAALDVELQEKIDESAVRYSLIDSVK